MPREKFEFTVLNDDDFNDAADILEAITLWDRLARILLKSQRVFTMCVAGLCLFRIGG